MTRAKGITETECRNFLYALTKESFSNEELLAKLAIERSEAKERGEELAQERERLLRRKTLMKTFYREIGRCIPRKLLLQWRGEATSQDRAVLAVLRIAEAVEQNAQPRFGLLRTAARDSRHDWDGLSASEPETPEQAGEIARRRAIFEGEEEMRLARRFAREWKVAARRPSSAQHGRLSKLYAFCVEFVASELTTTADGRSLKPATLNRLVRDRMAQERRIEAIVSARAARSPAQKRARIMPGQMSTKELSLAHDERKNTKKSRRVTLPDRR